MSKKKPTYQQLDIMAALRGKDVIFEDKNVEIDATIKKITPIDICKDIRWDKSGKCLDTEAGKQAFVPFLIIKILSMDTTICPLLNTIQQYMSVLSKEQLYVMLLDMVPKDKGFYKYIKNAETEEVSYLNYVTKYFQCSKKEAKEYADLLGKEWTQKFINKCGDFNHE
jgi:hypothetical protein